MYYNSTDGENWSALAGGLGCPDGMEEPPTGGQEAPVEFIWGRLPAPL